MPILDLGYRGWDGSKTLRFFRWMVVAAAGISLVWRGLWLRRLLIISFFPCVISAAGFFIYENSVRSKEPPRMLATVLARQARNPDLAKKLLADPNEVRHEVWSTMLLWFFRYPQSTMMVIVVGIVAPRLISYDMRSRGYLLYLSRPLSPAEYLLGKSAVLWFLLVMISTLPALAVYFAGVLLSPEINALYQTWDLPFRVLVASLFLVVPTSAVAICYSAFTTESRFAGFAWFATWILGWVTYSILEGVSQIRPDQDIERHSPWIYCSPYHTLGQLQAGIFGLQTHWYDSLPALILITAVTVVSILLAYHRISSTLKV